MEGWIKLYRKFSDWEWFNISEMVHLFIYLLLNANHEDGEWRGVKIQRGQILTGLKTLNERTKISFQTLRTCLKRLEKTKEINIQVTNKYSIITICNYESYQNGQQITNKQANKELTSNQQATNKQLTTNNNKNNNNNGNKENTYIEDSDLNFIFLKFLEMRKKIRKPASDYAIKLLIGKLNKLSSDKSIQTAIIEQSIIKGWQDFFPINNYDIKKPNPNDPDEFLKQLKAIEARNGN
jgi:hypothetical protein